MAKRVVVDVKPQKAGDGWTVEQRGGGTISNHRTKPPAIQAAKRVAKSAELGQVVIRKENGRVQTEYTYRQDPRRRKG